MNEAHDNAEGDAPGAPVTQTDPEAALESSASSSGGAGGRADVETLPLRSRDRYELLGEHAHGGLGTILRARDRELGRSLAIKQMRAPHADAAARFVREALVTARLEHPAIVPVHEAGRWETGEPFYAMKLVSGRTLKEVVAETSTLVERMALLPNIIAVVDAIAYAHSEGVLHRDLKASNVLIGAFGETIVIDWGLAKDLTRPDEPGGDSSPYRVNADYTVAGAVVGTPGFMPPEQARGEEVDERADVYALGALLYYTLTGAVPHEGSSSAQVLDRARTQAPRPLAERVPGVPPDLAAIVGKAMARERDDRYAAAQELAADLKRFAAGQMVRAHAYSWSQRLSRWLEKHRAAAALSALFAVVAAVGITAFVLREQRLRREAEAQRDRADQRTVALLEQQGRSELAAGYAFRAAVYLSEALLRKPDDLALHALLTQAVRPMARFERRLVGHTHDVTSVEYSPAGDRLVTTSWDKTARIWASDTGELLHVLPVGTEVEHASFSPDGSLVATEAADKVVRIWNVATGQLAQSFPTKRLYRVWFLPDGKRVVVGDSFGGLRFHDVATGAVLADGTPHRDRIHAAAFSPDGSTMWIASYDHTVSVWDLRTLAQTGSIRDHESDVTGVAVSRDGRWLLTAEEDVYLHVRRADTGERWHTIRLPESAKSSAATFSADGRTIVVRSHDGIVRTYHAASGVLLSAIDVQPTGKLFATALRPDGKQLAAAGTSGAVSLWAWGADPGYRLLDLGPDVREHVLSSGYTPDGERIVVGGGDGTVSLCDAASGERLASFSVPDNAYSSVSNRDGSRIAVTTDQLAFPPGEWDPFTGARLADLGGHARKVYNLAVSADGDTMATASYDGTVRLYDTEDARPLRTIEVDRTTRISAVAFHPDGSELAAVNENGKVFFFDRATGAPRRTWQAHATWIQDVEYSPDGARLLTCGWQDHTAKVWSTRTDALELTLSGHTAAIKRGAWSPDGRVIATSGMDHVARLWDARTGRLMRSIPGPSHTVVFSRDGGELLTTGQNGYAVIWEMALDPRTPEELAELVRARSPWVLAEGHLELR